MLGMNHILNPHQIGKRQLMGYCIKESVHSIIVMFTVYSVHFQRLI